MSSRRSGPGEHGDAAGESTWTHDGRDDAGEATWTNETLSISMRRQLLESELRKLGFRTGAAAPVAKGAGGPSNSHPQPDAGAHPRADAEGDGHSE